MASFAEKVFSPPAFYNFRPFFTIQPVQASREKQLKLWRELVVSYHAFHKSFRLSDPMSFPYFRNDAISRQLSPDGIRAVIDSLIQEGLAEWEDANNPVNLLIMSKSSATLASELYAWAEKEALLDSVITMYDIHSGEDYVDSAFANMDPLVIRKALEVLEASGKVLIIEGSSQDETGVKFLPI
jgi:ESCRT-II complex subunit VPS25